MDNSKMNSLGDEVLFKGGAFLPIPKEIPIPRPGRVTVVMQFLIPFLAIDKGSRTEYEKLTKRITTGLDVELSKAVFDSRQGDDKNPQVTLVSLSFGKDEDDWDMMPSGQRNSVVYLLIERFIGLLTFCLGIRLLAIHRQITVINSDKEPTKVLRPSAKTSSVERKLKIPSGLLKGKSISDRVLSALFWLRRGIADCDPVEAYSALMVCLQILARHLVKAEIEPITCPYCNEKIEERKWGDTRLFHTLLTEVLGIEKKKAKRLWKLRSAIVAHGGIPVDAEVIVKLTELKYDAVDYAFKALNIALGLNENEHCKPDRTFFVTDAFLYVD